MADLGEQRPKVKVASTAVAGEREGTALRFGNPPLHFPMAWRGIPAYPREAPEKTVPTMPITAYQASVPVFVQSLEALSATLGKASLHAAARKLDPGVFCQARLFPDMFPLSKQVQLAADFAKNASSRLAGIDPPRFSDDEKTFEELQARIARTLAHIRGLDRAAIEAGDERSITIPVAGQPTTFKGAAYLLHFALPNFFFHATAAYAILRENGVELGKRDFVGAIPT